MIRYMGTKTTENNAKFFVFLVNGMRKEVRENDLRLHPGCYDTLPEDVKKQIAANRAWLAQI
jgi:hypothetical protein